MSPPSLHIILISSVPTWLKIRGGPWGQGWYLFLIFEFSAPSSGPGGLVMNIEWTKGLGYHGKIPEKGIFILTCQWLLYLRSPKVRESGIPGTWKKQKIKKQQSETQKRCLGRSKVPRLWFPSYTPLSAARAPAPLPVPIQPLGQWSLQMGKLRFSG